MLSLKFDKFFSKIPPFSCPYLIVINQDPISANRDSISANREAFPLTETQFPLTETQLTHFQPVFSLFSPLFLPFFTWIPAYAGMTRQKDWRAGSTINALCPSGVAPDGIIKKTSYILPFIK